MIRDSADLYHRIQEWWRSYGFKGTSKHVKRLHKWCLIYAQNNGVSLDEAFEKAKKLKSALKLN